jgi:hypothetical protein
MAFKKIPIAHTISSSETDFPLLIKPSVMTGWTSLTTAEAESIRFYADVSKTTELPREVVSADEIHFKKGTLANGDSIYADYDGIRSDYAITATYGAQNVWNSNYKGVWHEPHGNATDSTSNGNNLTDNNTVLSTTGQIGDGGDFNSTNSEYLSITDASQTGLEPTDDITVSSWVNLNSSGDGDNWVFGKDDNTKGRQYVFGYDNLNGTDKMHMQINGIPAGISGQQNSTAPRGATTLSVGSWQLLHWHFKDVGNVREYFYNGSSDESGTNADATIPSATAEFKIHLD